MEAQDRPFTEIASPCIRNCCLDDQDICLGCLRSLDEICHWSNLDNQQRLDVLTQAAKRKSSRK